MLLAYQQSPTKSPKETGTISIKLGNTEQGGWEHLHWGFHILWLVTKCGGIGGTLPLCDSACSPSHRRRKEGEHWAVWQEKFGGMNKLFHVYELLWASWVIVECQGLVLLVSTQVPRLIAPLNLAPQLTNYALCLSKLLSMCPGWWGGLGLSSPSVEARRCASCQQLFSPGQIPSSWNLSAANALALV